MAPFVSFYSVGVGCVVVEVTRRRVGGDLIANYFLMRVARKEWARGLEGGCYIAHTGSTAIERGS